MGAGIKCCRGCIDRAVGCHSWCKRYLAEKKKHDELMEAVRYDNDTTYYVISQYDKAREKAAKKKEDSLRMTVLENKKEKVYDT